MLLQVSNRYDYLYNWKAAWCLQYQWSGISSRPAACQNAVKSGQVENWGIPRTWNLRRKADCFQSLLQGMRTGQKYFEARRVRWASSWPAFSKQTLIGLLEQFWASCSGQFGEQLKEEAAFFVLPIIISSLGCDIWSSRKSMNDILVITSEEY